MQASESRKEHEAAGYDAASFSAICAVCLSRRICRNVSNQYMVCYTLRAKPTCSQSSLTLESIAFLPRFAGVRLLEPLFHLVNLKCGATTWDCMLEAGLRPASSSLESSSSIFCCRTCGSISYGHGLEFNKTFLIIFWIYILDIYIYICQIYLHANYAASFVNILYLVFSGPQLPPGEHMTSTAVIPIKRKQLQQNNTMQGCLMLSQHLLQFSDLPERNLHCECVCVRDH